MNHFTAALAARAYRVGRALRSSRYRHRHLVARPLAVVVWQLAAEPFSAAAIGWGDCAGGMSLSVAGEPRAPELAFDALRPFARWFNARFEAHMARRETRRRGDYTFEVATTAPQILVANDATAEALGKLGRRLAYPAPSRPLDESLVRLGRHLRFLWERQAVPGQQLLISLTGLLADHWVSPQSPMERQSLAPLDAWIEPPAGTHGFDAAATAEGQAAGPLADGEEEQKLYPLVEHFNKARAGRTDPAIVRPLLGPIEDFYRPLVEGAWRLLWRCRDREAKIAEAASVGRRWDDDREAYTRHMSWLASGGFRRTRQTPRQTAQTVRKLEEAGRILTAEQACDDPLRMAPELLAGRAVRGQVIEVDRDHRERGPKNMVRRPLVRLLSPDPCLMPRGKELWWSEQPSGTEFVVHDVEAQPDGCHLVTLKLMTQSAKAALPSAGTDACFSVHNTNPAPWLMLPEQTPWTHDAPAPAAPASIEETEEAFAHGND